MRAMKDSGIAWIGEIPEGWKVVRHKDVMFKLKDIQEQYQGQDIISLTMGGVIVRDLDAGGKMPTSFDGYQKVYAGNLLMCLFDIDVTPRCVGLIKNNGVTSPAYSQFVLTQGWAPYYDYLLRYMDDEKCLLQFSKNLRSSLTETDFGTIATIIPPLAEQRGIAAFLDTKCAEVDELLNVQEQFIEELKNYKQALITETVTKGLNPNTKTKQSGIEWIGEIPESFEIRRLKYIGTAENGLTYSPNDVCDCADGGILVLRSSNIQNGKLVFDDNVYVHSAPSQLYVHKGDIILCSRNGSAALVGKSAMVEDEIFATFGAFMMRFHSEYNNKYIHLLLTAAISQYKQLFSTTTINQLTVGVFGNLEMPFVKDIAEQEEIAAYLDQKCAEIDQLIALKQQKAEELREYRKSLIYEYVTGKKQL